MKTPVTIPDEPDFSPADVALILDVSKQNVDYWITQQKLHLRPHFRGKIRIARDELIRFCREYLQLKF